MGEEERVRDMAAVAEQLRLVRAARRKFMGLWTIEQALVEPLIDRLEADLGVADGVSARPVHDPRPQADKG